MTETWYIILPSILLILALLGYFGYRLSHQMRGHLQQDLQQMVNNQNAAQLQINQRIQTQEQQITEMIYQRFEVLNQKIQITLDKNTVQTHENLSHLRERLSVIDSAQQKITDLSSQVVTLQDILSNKQARGAFGEIQLQDLVSSILPPSAYEFQKTLSNNKRVDCLLKLPNPPGSIGVDAKFPLESYRGMVTTQIAQEKDAYAKVFKSDMVKHINAIAEKYIIPGETAQSALLFLPSEAIYAELHTNFPDIIRLSFEAKVWIVSPTTLMATLNTIRAILKDATMREQGALIQKEVALLMKDIGVLATRLQKLDSHFYQAVEDIRLLNQTIEKISKRAINVEEIELGKNTEDVLGFDEQKLAS
ncbi:MAG: DNA recombination protein RmuC [Alphaproteobacteria bacterium]|nr:DNA recombination protein RmuC [Alphaproteobacteria bacterium]